MTTVSKTAQLVQKKQTDDVLPRVRELRIKIQDKSYIDNAIARIAQVISNRLVEDPETLALSGSGTIPVSMRKYR